MSHTLRGGASRRFLRLTGLGAALLCTAPALAQQRAPARLDHARFDAADLVLVQTDARTGAPTFLSGRLRAAQRGAPADVARAFLAENAEVFGLDARADVVARDVVTDELGLTHVRVQQTVGGVPVFGGDAYVHLDRQGAVYAYSGHLQPDAAEVSTTPGVSEASALAAARADVGVEVERAPNDLSAWTPSAHLVVYPTEAGPRLAYHVRLYAERPYPANWEVFVDAQTGAVIERWNAIHTAAGPSAPEAAAAAPTPATGSGNSLYSGTVTIQTDYTGSTYRLFDATRGSGVRTRTANNGTSLPGSDITDSDNNFTATAARAGIDAHWGAGQVYDYFLATHNRNSYNGAGAALNSTVHYASSYNNAYWDGVQMVYGDGDGSSFSALVELDICAHELTHAVTERTANLVYNREPGALNESVSDIFAVMVDRNDWWVGENSRTPGTAGDALRYMDTPTRGSQPDHYANRLYPGTCTPSDANDYCGVHSNSGIPNHAAYLMAAGGTKSGVTVTAIGRGDTERIWYRALTSYFTTSTNFAGARAGTIQAATDLFGAASAQVTAVTNAWAAVGVGSGGGTPPSDTYEPNGSISAAYGPLTSGTTYSSFITSASDDDYFKFTVAATGTVSVNLSGFSGDYDLFLYNAAGTEVARGYTSNNPETITYNATATGTYYVRVDGYNGAYSTTDDYQLRVTFPTGGGGGTAQWYYETRTYETAHNYANNFNGSHTYSKPGAQQVAMYFERFETEANYDFVYIRDAGGTTRATHHGTKAAFWAIVSGATITANLVTDASVVRWGYRVTQVAYYSTAPLVAGGEPGGTPMETAPRGAPSDPVVAAAKALETGLGPVQPNPAQGAAALTFALEAPGAVRLAVLDVLGREVAVLVDDTREAGEHAVAFDTGALPAGAYVVVLDTEGGRHTGRMTVTR